MTELKTKFLVGGAVSAPAPKWATYVFRTVLILTTAASGFIVTTTLVDEAAKTEIIAALKGLDFVVWGLSRLFGVVIDKGNE